MSSDFGNCNITSHCCLIISPKTGEVPSTIKSLKLYHISNPHIADFYPGFIRRLKNLMGEPSSIAFSKGM